MKQQKTLTDAAIAILDKTASIDKKQDDIISVLKEIKGAMSSAPTPSTEEHPNMKQMTQHLGNVLVIHRRYEIAEGKTSTDIPDVLKALSLPEELKGRKFYVWCRSEASADWDLADGNSFDYHEMSNIVYYYMLSQPVKWFELLYFAEPTSIGAEVLGGSQ